jgi:hypothetical protein
MICVPENSPFLIYKTPIALSFSGPGMKGHVYWLSVHCEDAKSEMSVRIRIESESGDSRFRPFFRHCFLNEYLLRLCPREFPFCYLWDPRSFVPRCHAPVLSKPKPRLRSLFLRRFNQYLIFLATLSRSCDRRGGVPRRLHRAGSLLAVLGVFGGVPRGSPDPSLFL